MKKVLKNNLDEMQEQKLLKIEHNGCWIAFWGLFIMILIQGILIPQNSISVVGEMIVFFCMSIYMFCACIKNNIWDRRLKPNLKTNIIISVITGVAIGIIYFIKMFAETKIFLSSFLIGGFMFCTTGILALVVLSISAKVYKLKGKKDEELMDKKEV